MADADEKKPAAEHPKSARALLNNDEHWMEIVNEWVDSHVRNSPIAANSEAWNHLHSALEGLRDILKKKLG